MKHTLGLRWWIGLGLLAATGCEVSVGKCEKDDAGECVDLFPDDYDASWMAGMDATTDASAPQPDAARSDASTAQDANVVADGSLDASATTDGATADATTPTIMTSQQFCDARFASARAWQTFFDDRCDCISSAEIADRNYFLKAALLYDDRSNVDCLNEVDGLKAASAKITYVAQSAAACANRFAAQFAAPPTACSRGTSPVEPGFDLELYESNVGHGVQPLAQLSECRATFVGKLGAGAACTSSFDCSGNLRCRAIPGAAQDGGVVTTCQAASLVNEACVPERAECAEGLTCARSNGSATGSVCIPVNELRPATAACRTSRDCSAGLVCNCPDARCDTGTCIAATAAAAADLICPP